MKRGLCFFPAYPVARQKTEAILNAASEWERGGPTRSEGSRGILRDAVSSNEIMQNLSVPIFLSKCRAGWSDRKMGTEKWGDMVGEEQRLFPASMPRPTGCFDSVPSAACARDGTPLSMTRDFVTQPDKPKNGVERFWLRVERNKISSVRRKEHSCRVNASCVASARQSPLNFQLSTPFLG